MKSDIFLTVLRRNTFNNIDQKYFQLLVFQGKKALMEKSDQNRQRKKKKRGEKTKVFEEKKLLSGQVVIEKLPVFHSRQ